jgi:uncharacterized protein (DUF1501 family)
VLEIDGNFADNPHACPISVRGRVSMPTPMTRRQLLQLGGLSAFGLSLPKLLSADMERPGRNSPKSCIFVYQYGGLSQLDSWDPKPNAPAELRGPYKPIATSMPGFRVGELMPQLAKQAHRYAVIRSMTHGVAIHDVANTMLLTGQTVPAPDAPAFGSVVAKLKPSTAQVPPYVWLQKFGGGAAPPDSRYLNAGFLGLNYAPLLLGVGPDDHYATPGYKMKAFDGDSAVSPTRWDDRKRLLATLDAKFETGTTTATHRERAFDLITGPTAKAAFDLDRESPALRDRYGRHPLGQNLILARRLIEAGVRLVSVVAWCGKKPTEKFMSIETWDMHGNAGVSIFDDGWNGLGFALPRCDQAVSTLLEDLQDRGLLDSTLVVLMGEFGRTPRISKGGTGVIGRDHWPRCYSGMLAGAGIRGGSVYGASDQQAAYVKDDPVTLEDFTATLYQTMGIPPETRLAPDGFTRPASSGRVLEKLL